MPSQQGARERVGAHEGKRVHVHSSKVRRGHPTLDAQVHAQECAAEQVAQAEPKARASLEQSRHCQPAPVALRRTTGGQLAVATERSHRQLCGRLAIVDEQQ